MTIAPRIISLIASATEIISVLGFEEALVGRSHECDYPPSVERLPACSEPRIDVDGTSREIDDRVKMAMAEGPSIYHVHAKLLQELRPDIIVTQDHCEVCAVSLGDVEQTICDLFETDPRIVALSPNNLLDVWNDIHQVADALDVPERGEELVGFLCSRLDVIAEKIRDIPARPTIACIEWIDPLMTAGNWVPELVVTAGGVNLFGEAGQYSPHLEWDQLTTADPDVIVVMPCGFDIPRTRQEMQAIIGQPQWKQLNAVRSHQVYLADGNQYFNRPGPRLVESAEILAEIIHPDRFDFGHAEIGWTRL